MQGWSMRLIAECIRTEDASANVEASTVVASAQVSNRIEQRDRPQHPVCLSQVSPRIYWQPYCRRRYARSTMKPEASHQPVILSA